MKKEDFLRSLSKKLENNFDINGEQELYQQFYDLHAVFQERTTRYMLFKEKEVYAYESFEHIYYQHMENPPDLDQVEALNLLLKNHVNEMIEVDGEHMSSVITFIWSSDSLPSKEVIKRIKRFRFHRSFAYGWKGWVNVKLVFVNLENLEVFTNRMGKDMKRLVRSESKWRWQLA